MLSAKALAQPVSQPITRPNLFRHANVTAETAGCILRGRFFLGNGVRNGLIR